MTTAATNPNVYDLLAERGMIAQSTDTAEGMRGKLASPVTVYNGFDPTADSLHVGHLVPMMGLAWMQRCGHKPVALVGGATALVGDPSGKSEARRMLTPEQVARNVEGLKRQLARVIRFDASESGGVMLNNADWLVGKPWIEMLREVGSVLSVNRMLGMESVKGRMNTEGEGISFLEFNYMVMQGYDFVHLHRTHGCTLQTGGQDQWGNIVIGIELGRKLDRAELLGLTFPLVTKSDGAKFGKTEGGAVWLDPARTSPYDFYQFFRNTADADVGRYLGYFTFLPMERVRELSSREGRELNEAKEVLAYEVTKIVHGEAEAETARDSARRAFAPGSGDVTGDAVPHLKLGAEEFREGFPITSALIRGGLAASNSEARRLIEGGGVRVHDERVSDAKRRITDADLREGHVVIRVGKKKIFRYDVA